MIKNNDWLAKHNVSLAKAVLELCSRHGFRILMRNEIEHLFRGWDADLREYAIDRALERDGQAVVVDAKGVDSTTGNFTVSLYIKEAWDRILATRSEVWICLDNGQLGLASEFMGMCRKEYSKKHDEWFWLCPAGFSRRWDK